MFVLKGTFGVHKIRVQGDFGDVVLEIGLEIYVRGGLLEINCDIENNAKI